MSNGCWVMWQKYYNNNNKNAEVYLNAKQKMCDRGNASHADYMTDILIYLFVCSLLSSSARLR